MILLLIACEASSGVVDPLNVLTDSGDTDTDSGDTDTDSGDTDTDSGDTDTNSGDTDTDSGDTDTDSGDTDSGDTDSDSSLGSPGMLFFGGDASTAGSRFLDGHVGWYYTDLHLNLLCTDLSEWTPTGGNTPRCPGCSWTFNLRAEGGSAVGDHCADAGLAGGDWDGVEGAWGFAETYDGYTTVLLYYTSYGWTPWSYNGGLYGDYNTGDASHVIFATFYEYLYYYP